MARTDQGSPSLPSAVTSALRCSVCGTPLVPEGHSLRCERRHTFDLARQGYVNLLHARIPAGTADTAEMVTARSDFLAAGHYAPLAGALAELAEAVTPALGLVLDAGAGPGYYLAAVLDRLPSATGLALDLSAPALRRAARAHPRLGAAVWNLWHPLPLADRGVSLLLNVFSPRNAAEFHRVLRPDGTLLVVSPQPGHLGELETLVGTLTVGAGKRERLDESLHGRFELTDRRECGGKITLSPADVRRAVLMGPSAYHLDSEGRGEKLDRIDEPVTVTTAFLLSVYRPVPG